MLGKIVAATGAVVVAAGLASGVLAVVQHHSTPRLEIAVEPAPVVLDPFVLDLRRLSDMVPMVCQPASATGAKTKAETETADGVTAPLPARKRK